MNTNHIPELEGELYLTESLLLEIKSNIAVDVFTILTSKYRLGIIIPDKQSISKAKQIIKAIGQNGLSYADRDLIALAIMLSKLDDVTVYSDDYAIKNVCNYLGINTIGVKTTGGLEKRKYKFKCVGCNKYYKTLVEECEICGIRKFRRYRN